MKTNTIKGVNSTAGSLYRNEVTPDSLEVQEFYNLPVESDFSLTGRLVLSDPTGRISKFGSFCEVNGVSLINLEQIESDGLSVKVFLQRNEENISMVNSVINYGDIVLLKGKKITCKTSETHVFVAYEVVLLSKCTGNIYDKNIDFKKRLNLYNYRYLDLIRNRDKISHFKKCSQVIKIIRQVLYENDYEEMNMTLLQESFEAGLATPFETHVVTRDKKMYLRLTAELFLRKLMLGGFTKIFEINKSFRNQGATAYTLPQFTILELYRAYAKVGEMENLLKDIICKILIRLYGSLTIPTENGQIDCSGEWPEYDFIDEVKKLTGWTYDEKCSIEEFVLVLDKVGINQPSKLSKNTLSASLYGHIVSSLKGPCFLHNLPAAQSPLFKINENGSTVDESLLIINGRFVADIVNPERDPSVLKRRLEEQIVDGSDLNRSINHDLVNAMNFGLPPCKGIGMGLERLIMILLNTSDIRDNEMFPVF